MSLGAQLSLTSLGLSLALGLGACLPNPQSTREFREGFPRAALEGELLLSQVPGGLSPVGAVFDKQIQLVGYKMEPAQPKRGDSVRITYYWTPLKSVPEDYKVFVHGEAEGGKAGRIHLDHYPADNRYPITAWRIGEVIADPFTLSIPARYPAPKLVLYSGLYKGEDRLRVTDAGRAKASDNRVDAVRIQLD